MTPHARAPEMPRLTSEQSANQTFLSRDAIQRTLVLVAFFPLHLALMTQHCLIAVCSDFINAQICSGSLTGEITNIHILSSMF